MDPAAQIQEAIQSLEMLLQTQNLSAATVKREMAKLKERIETWHFLSDVPPAMGGSPASHLRLLLLRAVTHAPILKVEEARRVLSLLFTVEKMEDLHTVIKNDLITNHNKTKAEYQGDLYYRAYKHALDQNHVPQKQQLQAICLRDLVKCAVLSLNPQMATAAKNCFVAAFGSRKEQKQIELLLFELLSPVIWRHLKSTANNQIRLQCAVLFLSLFPVRNPMDQGNAVSERLQQNCDAITALLSDDCAVIRVVAITSVCNQLLVNYWVVFTKQFLKSTLLTLTNDLSCDVTSVDVRAAVIDGMAQLTVKCAACTDAMVKLLPKLLKTAIQDTSEKVRRAAVNLLMLLKDNKHQIKFYELVPLPILLLRLAIDQSAIVCKTITQLLWHSYVPLNKGDDDVLRRSAELVMANSMAARTMYKHGARLLSPKDSVTQICTLLRGAYAQMVSECANEHSALSALNIDNTVMSEIPQTDVVLGDVQQAEGEGDTVTGSAQGNIQLVSGLLDCAVILFVHVQKTLQTRENEPQKVKLERMMAKIVPRCLRLVQDEHCVDALFTLGARLRTTNDNDLSYLRKQVMSKLQEMDMSIMEQSHTATDNDHLHTDNDQNRPPDTVIHTGRGQHFMRPESSAKLRHNHRPFLTAACAWRLDELLTLITDWLQVALPQTSTVPDVTVTPPRLADKERPSKKTIQFAQDHQQKAVKRPDQALRYLSDILDLDSVRAQIIKSNWPSVMQLLQPLQNAQCLIEKCLQQNDVSALCDHFTTSDLSLCVCIQYRIHLLNVTVLSAKDADRTENNDPDEMIDEEERARRHRKSCVDWLCAQVQWLIQKVMPFLTTSLNDQHTLHAQCKLLIHDLLKNVCDAVHNSLRIVVYSPELAQVTVSLILLLLTTDSAVCVDVLADYIELGVRLSETAVQHSTAQSPLATIAQSLRKLTMGIHTKLYSLTQTIDTHQAAVQADHTCDQLTLDTHEKHKQTTVKCSEQLHSLWVFLCTRAPVQVREQCSSALLVSAAIRYAIRPLMKLCAKEDEVFDPRDNNFAADQSVMILVKKMIGKNVKLANVFCVELTDFVRDDAYSTLLQQNGLHFLSGTVLLAVLLHTHARVHRSSMRDLCVSLDRFCDTDDADNNDSDAHPESQTKHKLRALLVL